MVNTAVSLCGIPLKNPVIPASGTFGFGYEFAELYDLNILGSISLKGTTRAPRFGNPTPRIAECDCGLLNAVGLQNPGVEQVCKTELPRLKEHFAGPVMANVSGFSIEDYQETCRRLDQEHQIGWFEINISCPNVHGGGMSFGTDPAAAAAVTRAVRQAGIGEAFPECNRYYRHCPRLRGKRCRRAEPDQYPSGHADRSENRAAGAGE